jgi:hypothetical protein
MKNGNPKSRKWILSFFMIFLMVFSAFIGMAGSAQDEQRPDNENDVESTGAIVGMVINIEAELIAGGTAFK